MVLVENSNSFSYKYPVFHKIGHCEDESFILLNKTDSRKNEK